MKRRIEIVIVVMLALANCSPDQKESEVIEIYLEQGEKNRKEFMLSYLVDEVEYVQLETRSDCYVTRARFDVSENYILVAHEYHPPQVMVFKRDGRLHALIGKQGKGPGEYHTKHPKAKISQDESWLVVYDSDGLALLQYTIDGKYLRTYNELDRSRDRISEFVITPDNQIVLFMYRPQLAASNYALVRVLDDEFNVIEESFEINKDDSEFYSVGGRPEIIQYGDELGFREPYYDTLFMKEPNGYRAAYHFNVLEPAVPGYFFSRKEEYNQMVWLNRIGNFFMCQGVKGNGEGTIETIFINLETQEVIRTKTENNINDIDGVGEYWIDIEPPEKYLVQALQIVDLKEAMDTLDLSEKVVFPDKRDELIRLVNEASEEDNAIVRLFRVR